MDGKHPENKVFILEGGEYIEITYAELFRRTEAIMQAGSFCLCTEC